MHFGDMHAPVARMKSGTVLQTLDFPGLHPGYKGRVRYVRLLG